MKIMMIFGYNHAALSIMDEFLWEFKVKDDDGTDQDCRFLNATDACAQKAI